MTPLKLQLEEFFLEKLKITFHPPESTKTTELGFSFSYRVARHKDDTKRFRLTLTMLAGPKEKCPPIGYVMDCQIVGLFSFIEDIPEEEMQQLIRINGCTILYGVLRGQIACVTGSFMGGKFTLPTVMMQDVVEAVEVERSKARTPKKTSGAKTEKKAST